MKEKLKQVKPRHVATFGGLASAASMILYKASENPEAISKFIGQAAANQMLQTGFFFTVAAWLHSSKVQREIKENFSSLTDAINNAAESLRNDLNSQSDILKNHTSELVNLTGRVQNVENNINSLKGTKL